MVYIFLISSMMFHFSKDVLLKNLIFDPFALDDKFYINWNIEYYTNQQRRE